MKISKPARRVYLKQEDGSATIVIRRSKVDLRRDEFTLDIKQDEFKALELKNKAGKRKYRKLQICILGAKETSLTFNLHRIINKLPLIIAIERQELKKRKIFSEEGQLIDVQSYYRLKISKGAIIIDQNRFEGHFFNENNDNHGVKQSEVSGIPARSSQLVQKCIIITFPKKAQKKRLDKLAVNKPHLAKNRIHQQITYHSMFLH